MKKIGIIILAAGLGTRLRPLTNNLPKVLIDINDKKVIDFAFENFSKIKIEDKEFLINTFYKSDLLINYLKEKKYKTFIYREKKLRGSLGSLYDNISWIKKKDYILLHYGDVLFDSSITRLIDTMIKLKKKSSMVVDIREKVNDVGVVKFNSEKILTEFVEKPKNVKGKQFVNSGLYLFEKKFLVDSMISLSKKLNIKNKLDFSEQFSKILINNTKIFIFKKNVIDIGNFENLEKAKIIFK